MNTRFLEINGVVPSKPKLSKPASSIPKTVLDVNGAGSISSPPTQVSGADRAERQRAQAYALKGALADLANTVEPPSGPSASEIIQAEMNGALAKRQSQSAMDKLQTADTLRATVPFGGALDVAAALEDEAKVLIDRAIHNRADYLATSSGQPYEVGYTQAVGEAFEGGVPASFVRNETAAAALQVQSALDNDVPTGKIEVFDRSRMRNLKPAEISEFAAWDGTTEVQGANADAEVHYGDRTASQAFYDAENATHVRNTWVWHPIDGRWQSDTVTTNQVIDGKNVNRHWDQRNPENSSFPERDQGHRGFDSDDHYDPDGDNQSFTQSLWVGYESYYPSNYDGHRDSDGIPDALTSFFGLPTPDAIFAPDADVPSQAGLAYTITDLIGSGIKPSTVGPALAVGTAFTFLDLADRYDAGPSIYGPGGVADQNMPHGNGLPADRSQHHLGN